MHRVVIIDDEEWIRALIREVVPFRALGLSVAGEAADGPAALALVEATSPDILIVDVRMGGMSGLELVAELRARGCMAECVIVSGYDDFAYAREAIRQGVAEYVLKPVDGAELGAALSRAMERLERRESLDRRIAVLEREKRRLARGACSGERPASPDAEAGKMDRRVREALEFVRERFNTPIGLEQAADRVSISPTYLSELFKRETGVGFAQYLSNLRMEEAESLLIKRPDLRVSDIAVAVGIADPDYFARAFRHRTGLAPSEFRNSGGRRHPPLSAGDAEDAGHDPAPR